MMDRWLMAAVTMLLLRGSVSIHYAFQEGREVKLQVNKMTSTKSLFPIDCYFFPFCQPVDGIMRYSENWGEILSGDRIKSSPYFLQMKQDMYCEQVCISNLGRHQMKGVSPNKVVRAIRKDYRYNWMVDNLPAAWKTEDAETVRTRYLQGFPAGFVAADNGKSYVYNHVNIEIMYHENESGSGLYSIVRFTVQPFSINHEFEPIPAGRESGTDDTHFLPKKANINNPIPSCTSWAARTRGVQHTSYDMVTAVGRQPQVASGRVLFTYDVIWIENRELKWANRWDMYLTMENAVPPRVHWISIANSTVLVATFMLLLVIMLRHGIRGDGSVVQHGEDSAAESDVANEDARAQSWEEKGWKVVHAETFGPPDYFTLIFSVSCGTGAQLLGMALVSVTLGCFGFFIPERRGQLIIIMVLAFVFLGAVNGYVTVRMYKTFVEVADWQGPASLAALSFPAVTLVALLLRNVICWFAQSTLTVPVVTLITLVLLWLTVSAPLVYCGAFIAYWQDSIRRLPNEPRIILLRMVSISTLRKMGRRSLAYMVLVGLLLLFNALIVAVALFVFLSRYMDKRKSWSPAGDAIFMLLVGGLCSFGSTYVELHYILTASWMHYNYCVFGFLLIVLLLMLATCAQVSILLSYFRLCNEEFYSWWWQFCCSGAVSIWVFLYSSVFYFRLFAEGSLLTFLTYFGYMAWACLALFLMTGFGGVIASLWFVRTMFSIADADEKASQPLASDEWDHGMALLSSPGPEEEEEEGDMQTTILAA